MCLFVLSNFASCLEYRRTRLTRSRQSFTNSSSTEHLPFPTGPPTQVSKVSFNGSRAAPGVLH
ncbi:hypothetical protein BpHYR1_024995 [Brachionus plicatilis]|uniref:Uncharacterized protein n=1 Tax=Brachionus plicatilis TaxID=10195 RepID=A0A3M7RV90_BRAPC|nr:hypothetical protein BpHYR1_024995 [Brachionus plicatilis]